MFRCLEFHSGGVVASDTTSTEQLLSRIRNFKGELHGPSSGLCILFEDINSDAAASLDSLLEIGPRFFYDHLATGSFHRLETRPASIITSPLPSRTYSENLAHFRFKRLLELETNSSLVPYDLCLEGNSQRNVRRMPLIPGCCVGIADSCLSIVKKDIGRGTWICMSSVDRDRYGLQMKPD